MKTLLIIAFMLLSVFKSCEKGEDSGKVHFSQENDTIKPSVDQEKTDDWESLAQKYEEIKQLAYSNPCHNPKEWAITPIGSKPCGGPAGFIAYSTKIDTDAFLKKVENYTNEHRNLNMKYGLVSDCAMERKPSGVECGDGKPKFVYE